MKELVSVIVPVFNNEKYINKCIESIINQTYKNLEIILIDDGSYDSSGKICDLYSELDNRIMVKHIENGGVSNARNVGLDIATGKYVSFIDSDDYVEKNMFENLIDIFENENLDIIVFNLLYEDLLERPIKINNCKNTIIERDKFPYEMFHNPCVKGFACNKIYKKSIINQYNIRFDNKIKVLEDDKFNYQIFKSNDFLKIKYINDIYYHYVQSASNVSNQPFNLNKITYLDSRIDEIDILLNEKINYDYLLLDYIVVYKRMMFLAKKNKIYSKTVFEKYYNYYCDNKNKITINNLNKKEIIKYFIIKYFPFIYYLKLINKKEK